MNPVVRKIQKLLALADDQAGLPEGEVAARLAHKLMHAHAIEMADLPIERQAEVDPLVDDWLIIGRLGWYSRLVWALGKHCNCEPYRYKSKWDSKTGKYVCKMRVIGHKSDAEIVAYLYAICRKQIDDAYARYRDLCKVMDGCAPGRAAAIAFKSSAVSALNCRLEAMREDDNQPGTALVLQRGTRAKAHANELIPNPGTPHRMKWSHSQAGYEAGKTIKLTTGVTGKPQPQIGEK